MGESMTWQIGVLVAVGEDRRRMDAQRFLIGFASEEGRVKTREDEESRR